jgi:Tfp pilus assembly protein PilX
MDRKIHKKQKGAVLIVALIFILVLTLLGVTAMDTTILETKLSAYAQERSWAFEIAEAGLEQAQVTLDNTLKTDSVATTFDNGVFAADTLNIKDIARANDVKASTFKTQIEYKGNFGVPRGAAAVANSATQIQMMYYETRTTGQSTEDAASVQITLRNGMRQAAPKQ